MTVLMVTKATGGKTRPAEMTVVAPGEEQSVEELRRVGEAGEVNGLFLADMLSALAANERATVRLCNASFQQTAREDLRKLYGGLAAEHLAHLSTYEDLMGRLGIDPMYVSPAARAATFQAERLIETPLIFGSVDKAPAEIMRLGAVVLLGARCFGNRQVVIELAKRVLASPIATALEDAADQFDAQGDGYLRHAEEMLQALELQGVLGSHAAPRPPE